MSIDQGLHDHYRRLEGKVGDGLSDIGKGIAYAGFWIGLGIAFTHVVGFFFPGVPAP